MAWRNPARAAVTPMSFRSVADAVGSQPPVMKAYQPSWAESLANTIADAAGRMGAGRYAQQDIAEKVGGVAGIAPGLGTLLDAGDTGQALGEGRYGDAALGASLMAVGAIPGGKLATKGVEKVAEALGDVVQPSIRAYHGSPHSFDKFSMDKIDTGEGAQAYGHGMYFAEEEDVAKNYQNFFRWKNTPITDWDNPEYVAQFFKERHGKEGAIEYLEGALKSNSRMKNWSGSPEITGAIDLLKSDAPIDIKPQGKTSMYEVNIKADPEKFLDYDAPVPMDHPIRGKLGSYPSPAAPNALETGKTAYNQMIQLMEANRDTLKGKYGEEALFAKNTELARRELVEVGIPGIKYLDQGSRASGKGTRNYVVFDDRLVDIVRKYGIAAAVGAGLISSEMAAQMQDQGVEGT